MGHEVPVATMVLIKNEVTPQVSNVSNFTIPLKVFMFSLQPKPKRSSLSLVLACLLADMYQRNPKHNTKRRVCRRPRFVSVAEVEKQAFQ